MAHKLKLHGIVGSWWDRNDSKSVTDEIDGLKSSEEIHVRINSPGGSVSHGVAIYNALRAHEGKVVVHVDALAASAASLIAMAGDEIIMGLGSMMMIHNPWSMTAGDADAHRKSADMLDKHAESMAGIYADGANVSQEDALEIMAAETWYSAQDAVEAGFATSVDGDEDANALADVAKFEDQLKKFNDVPAQFRTRVAAAMRKAPAATINGSSPEEGEATATQQPPTGDDMTIEDKNKRKNAPQSGEPAAEVIDIEAEKAEAEANGAKAERERITEIQKACNAASLDDTFAKQLIDGDVSLDEARAKIIDELYAQAPEPTANINTSITGGKTARQKFFEGAEQAISARAGLEDVEDVNEFRGYSLREIAREAARHDNIDVSGMTPMAMVGEVLAAAGHSTSDFPKILENVAYKSMLKGFDEADESFQQWTAAGSVSDFKPASRAGLNSLPELDTVPEGGEYKYVTTGERSETIQAATYGNLFSITRQAIINDDMRAFTRIPALFGSAAIRTIGTLVANVLINNQSMYDGNNLFVAAHSNVATNALGMDALNTGRAAMRKQTDAEGTTLNITPAYLLVPAALEALALQLMQSQYEPGDAGNVPNTARGMAEVIVDPRFDADSATRWYLAANPNLIDTIEVVYLNGVRTPTLERQMGWSRDGVEYKVRMDAGVKALEWRGLYRSTG